MSDIVTFFISGFFNDPEIAPVTESTHTPIIVYITFCLTVYLLDL
nr:MAG TPA: hypothetical protein [Caudoviricetes sp.]